MGDDPDLKSGMLNVCAAARQLVLQRVWEVKERHTVDL